MSNLSHPNLRITRRFDASAEKVFNAFLDPAIARKWMFATPTGKIERAEIDARVGGTFCFTDRRDDVDVEHVGKYLELERPTRLVFVFTVPKYSSEESRVNIDIASQGSGCNLTLTHQHVPPEHAERTQAGWTKMLEGLARVL
jgi:uncharacterized protein YndB with AHSA1/START domain